mmetsp:Transcript_38016/g.79016  ORF Transcript_38016/g.79016 Transcript_38016/m.79016 type:complete len:508 (-) Transcript_38016:78-1601(-)
MTEGETAIDIMASNIRDSKNAPISSEAASQALLIFSPSILTQLNQAPHRLPTTYAGVRRVRPSSKHVQHVWAHNSNNKDSQQQQQPSSTSPSTDGNHNHKRPPVCYKMKDPVTGEERRMTNAEKKAAKRTQRKEWERQKIQARQEREEQQQQANEDEDVLVESSTSPTKFVQLKLNATALEQELADLQGEARHGQVPPALLSASQAQAAYQGTLAPSKNNACRAMDETWSQQWAATLTTQSLQPAVTTRTAEINLRPLVYDIVPQPWRRLRPNDMAVINCLAPTESTTTATATTTPKESESTPPEKSTSTVVVDKPTPKEKEEDSSDPPPETLTWSTLQQASVAFTVRPPSHLDRALHHVVAWLHACPQLHLSCGAKFGCDLLLYDGPRSERHAFAGLRVVVVEDDQGKEHDEESNATPTQFPLPRAYDLAGYVRCLNTAGKLALLATVVPQPHSDEESPRVAVLDLALEKIPTHESDRNSNQRKHRKRKQRPPKTLEDRLQNLAKH